MTRDARPLVGVIAGTGIDGPAWLRQTPLPDSHRWQLVDPGAIPPQTAWLLWLWNTAPEQDDLPRLGRCQDRLLRERRNQLVPILFVDAAPDVAANQAWQDHIQHCLRRVYARRLNRVAPRALTDRSLTIVEGAGTELGSRLTDRGQQLLSVVSRWRRRLQQQAAQCLKAGLGFTAVYVLLLLASFPWHPSPPLRSQPRGLLDWTWAQWRQHLDACRALLKQLQGKQWYQLDRDTQAQFTQYLRWLPVSLDLLRQRETTTQSRQYMTEITTLLGQMETAVNQWTAYDARAMLPASLRPVLGELIRLRVKQRLTEELLDNVFDPRPGTTELHRLAEQFWIDERSYTQLLLRTVVAKITAPADRLTACIQFLRDRLQLREATRVHAPNRKLAYLQELEQALEWCLKLQQGKKPVTNDDFRQPSTPELIRVALATS